MARAGSGLIDRLADRSALRRWSRLASQADTLPIDDLRGARARAKALQSKVSKVLAAAEERLTLPFSGAGAIRQAQNADWAWRPGPWRGPVAPHGRAAMVSGTGFGESVKVFHDCPLAENALRQIRNVREADLAPYGLRLDLFGFEGSFMSLVVDLPEEGLHGLTRRHLIRVGIDLGAEKRLNAFLRLNLKHGPNTEDEVQEITVGDGSSVEFDLGFLSINEARIEAAWVELIFEAPALNQIMIRDFIICRRARAEV